MRLLVHALSGPSQMQYIHTSSGLVLWNRKGHLLVHVTQRGQIFLYSPLERVWWTPLCLAYPQNLGSTTTDWTLANAYTSQDNYRHCATKP